MTAPGENWVTVDIQRPPVPEVISHRLEMGQSGAKGLHPTHPVVRYEIVQERTKLELPMLRRRELPEPLPVGGELVELLPMESLGKL